MDPVIQMDQYSYSELERHWILDTTTSPSVCRQELGTVREHFEEWFQCLYIAILQIVKNIPEQIITMRRNFGEFHFFHPPAGSFRRFQQHGTPPFFFFLSA